MDMIAKDLDQAYTNVEAEIKRRLEPEGFNFREYRVTEDAYRNLPIMLVNMKPQPEDIFLIYDLKKALPEVLEYLNYRREDFVEHNISAIFWLDEPTLTRIAREALDFWAFRSLPVFEFNVDHSQDMVIPGRTIPSEIFIYDSLEELDAKIALREEMLNEYLEKRPDALSTIADFHNELGVLYLSKSRFDAATVHFRKGLELYRGIRDKRGEAPALGNMGSVYKAKGDLDKALEFCSEALEIHRRIGDVEGEGVALGNMGLVYRAKGDLATALDYTKKALRIYVSICARLYADKAYGNIEEMIEQMETAGMELSEEDRKEIAQLTEEYEKLKGEAAGVATS